MVGWGYPRVLDCQCTLAALSERSLAVTNPLSSTSTSVAAPSAHVEIHFALRTLVPQALESMAAPGFPGYGQTSKGTLIPGQSITVNKYNVQVERYLSQGAAALKMQCFIR